MTTGFRLAFVWVLLAICVAGVDCASTPSPAPDLASAPVYIISTEGLTAPAIGFEKAYQVGAVVEIDPGGSVGQAGGFRLTVATRAPEVLRTWLRDLSSGAAQELQRVDPPTPQEQAGLGDGPRPFSAQARDLLRAGRAIFWQDDSAGSGDAMEHRFVLLVPESARGPFVQIEVFTATTSDGSPLGADRIELVRGFYYLTVLGDSIAWGNGLLDLDKYPALVARVIEQATQRKVIRQTLALSGARIVPGPTDGICGLSCYREAPVVLTSITAQVDMVEHPELTELVLMDGCINDIGIGTIIDTQTTPEQLKALSSQFCHDEMAKLIAKVRDRMPQAPIVVTSYYPIISLSSYLLGLDTWSQSQNVTPSEDLTTFIEGASANSLVFAESSRIDLAAAVQDAIAARPGGPGIAFVDPGFTPDNAIFTPQSWLWGLTSDDSAAQSLSSELMLFPEDPQLPSRISVCLNDTSTELPLGCLYASVGHPNKLGAAAYAEAIVTALREAGLLPPAQTP